MTDPDAVSVTCLLSPYYILTANQRIHWAARAEKSRIVRDRFAAEWARVRDQHPRMPRAQALALFTFSDRRRRDSANLHPTIKAAVDGVVTGPTRWPQQWDGLLPDDDHTRLLGPTAHILPPDKGLRDTRQVLLTLVFRPWNGETP